MEIQRSLLGVRFPRLLRFHNPLSKSEYIKAYSCPLKKDPGQQRSAVNEIFKSEQHGEPDVGELSPV